MDKRVWLNDHQFVVCDVIRTFDDKELYSFPKSRQDEVLEALKANGACATACNDVILVDRTRYKFNDVWYSKI